MHIVTTFGIAYSLTDSKYKKLMQDITENKDINLDNYGKYLGKITNITDMTSEEAKEILEDLTK